MLLYVYYVIVACVCVVVVPFVVVYPPYSSYLPLPPFSCSRCHAMCLAKQSLRSTVVGLQNCAALVACVHVLQSAVDDRAGGWTKDWMGDDGATVAVAVPAVATADVVAALVATETAMLQRRRRRRRAMTAEQRQWLLQRKWC